MEEGKISKALISENLKMNLEAEGISYDTRMLSEERCTIDCMETVRMTHSTVQVSARQSDVRLLNSPAHAAISVE